MARTALHRPRRHIALAVLGLAVIGAIAAFPVRHRWWGGWLLAMCEAGIVGGLADWFAVTAIFRRPLGLPIPHTALIPANWELMASRVGSMVGDRVLTRSYVAEELARLDLSGLLAAAAARITREDIEGATRAASRWLAEQVPSQALGDLLERARHALATQPVAPLLARGLEVAHGHGWAQRAVGAVARALREALDRPAMARAVDELVEDFLRRFREGSFWVGLADAFGLIDRARIVDALRAGLRDLADDAEHPLRISLLRSLAELPGRLRADAALAARVELAKQAFLESTTVRGLLEEAATALQRTIRADLARPRSELVQWVADRLERARATVAADEALRAGLERWIKRRATELIERHHGRMATFIEKGVLALGPEGAVRLIEEHAGDDLQYIRINGTVVGGLAGAAIYGVHLLTRLL